MMTVWWGFSTDFFWFGLLTWAQQAAAWIGCHPSSSWAWMSTFASIKNSTTFSKPWATAIWSCESKNQTIWIIEPVICSFWWSLNIWVCYMPDSISSVDVKEREWNDSAAIDKRRWGLGGWVRGGWGGSFYVWVRDVWKCHRCPETKACSE